MKGTIPRPLPFRVSSSLWQRGWKPVWILLLTTAGPVLNVLSNGGCRAMLQLPGEKAGDLCCPGSRRVSCPRSGSGEYVPEGGVSRVRAGVLLQPPTSLSVVIPAPSRARVVSGPISSCSCQTPIPATCQISRLKLSSPFQAHPCVPGLGLLSRKPPPRGAPCFFMPLLHGLSVGEPALHGGKQVGHLGPGDPPVQLSQTKRSA